MRFCITVYEIYAEGNKPCQSLTLPADGTTAYTMKL